MRKISKSSANNSEIKESKEMSSDADVSDNEGENGGKPKVAESDEELEAGKGRVKKPPKKRSSHVQKENEGNASSDVSEENKNGAPEISEDEVENGGKSTKDESLDGSASDEEAVKKPPKKRSSHGKKKKKSSKKAEDEEYEVEAVVDSKKIKGKLHYLIRWKGFSSKDDTWEPVNTLSCKELIEKYNEENKDSKQKKDTKGKKRKSGGGPSSGAKKSKHDEDDDEDEGAEYEVERILEVQHKKNGDRHFLIHWKGWAAKYNSWEPESNLNCTELINKFMEKVEKAKKIESRSLRTAPESTKRFTLAPQAKGRRLSKRQNQKQRVRYDDAE